MKERRGGHPNTPAKQQQTRRSANPRPVGGEFLNEHKGSEERDPGQVHNAENKQQRHQRPTAEQAVPPVTEAHNEGTELPLSPFAHYKREGAAALVEAGKLEWRELVQSGRDQNCSTPLR